MSGLSVDHRFLAACLQHTVCVCACSRFTFRLTSRWVSSRIFLFLSLLAINSITFETNRRLPDKLPLKLYDPGEWVSGREWSRKERHSFWFVLFARFSSLIYFHIHFEMCLALIFPFILLFYFFAWILYSVHIYVRLLSRVAVSWREHHTLTESVRRKKGVHSFDLSIFLLLFYLLFNLFFSSSLSIETMRCDSKAENQNQTCAHVEAEKNSRRSR